MTPGADPPSYDELRQRLEALSARLTDAERAARESELRRMAMEGELRRLHTERGRELQQVVAIATVALRDVREQVERIEGSTAWRVGHRAALTLAHARFRRPKTNGAVAAARERIDAALELLAPWRGNARPEAQASAGPAVAAIPRAGGAAAPAGGAARRATAIELRERLGSIPVRERWPGVSILVRNHEGEQRLPRLLEALRSTDYPGLEVVVLDLASSSDESLLAPFLGGQAPYPVRVVRAEAGITSGAAGNEAARLAQHELLLFLDTGSEPVERGWCKELVDCLLSTEAGAIGATLVRPILDARLGAFPVSERGLILSRGAARGELSPVDDGTELLGSRLGLERECVAVSGVCSLVDASAFWRAGGFNDTYRDGLEHIDLALTMRAAGELVACSGRAVVLHDDPPAGPQLARGANARALAERWGPALRRELRLGLARRDPAWVGEQFMHALLVRPSGEAHGGHAEDDEAAALGAALGDLGWRVSFASGLGDTSHGPLDGDVVVAFDDAFEPGRLDPEVTAVAWIRAAPERWFSRGDFDRYDILLAASRSLADRIEAATGRTPVLFPLATNPSRFAPAQAVAELACDICVVLDHNAPLVLDDALSPRRSQRVAIYGRGWSDVKRLRSHVKGAVGEAPLPAVYASSRVMVDEQPEPERLDGTLPGRVFDALASGTPVITNAEASVRELFDQEFPVWSDADTLRTALDGLLTEPERHATLARRYRRRVLAEHTYLHRAQRLRELVAAGDERLSFCLKIGAPDSAQSARWGDLYVARDLARALKRRGHRCLIQVRAEWDEPSGAGCDVAVHLKGQGTYAPRPAQFNVLWLISHPAALSTEEVEAYDLVCVASAAFARELEQRVTVPVAVLEQATDPWRFYPDPDPALAHEIAFVGNGRGARRPLLEALRGSSHDLAVWGSGLSGMVDDRHLRGEWFPNEELRRVYASAKLVVCDHWEDMRVNGFASNRLYDVVASGAVVVSDAVTGLDDRFGDAVVSCSTVDEVRATVTRLLDSDEERAQRARGARERVVAGHTFDDRARVLLEEIERHEPDSGHRARVAPQATMGHA